MATVFRPLYRRSIAVLSGARMTSAIAVTALGLAFFSRLIRALIGWPGLAGALTVLCLLAAGSVFARRASLEWRGLLPISLLIFVGWCGTTIFWSNHQWATLSGALYQLAFLILGICVALTRDLIQLARAVGDVVRFALALSLALEVFAGVLIDMPIPFLSIEGNLGSGFPIQGVFGARNLLGLVALIGLVTFGIEFATRSVTRMTAVFSLALAGVSLLLTRSPVAFLAVLAVLVATIIVLALRRLPRSSRTWAQWGMVALLGVTAVLGWAFRGQIIASLNAGTELGIRYRLWLTVRDFINLRPLEGWGWVGLWRPDVQPFIGINSIEGRAYGSALNAFVDVWFQTGLVGLFCFAVLLALTFWRSWALAVSQRGLVYLWPALILVALLAFSLFESVLLVEYGWILFVMCSVAAAHRLSWRRRYKPDALSDAA